MVTTINDSWLLSAVQKSALNLFFSAWMGLFTYLKKTMVLQFLLTTADGFSTLPVGSIPHQQCYSSFILLAGFNGDKRLWMMASCLLTPRQGKATSQANSALKATTSKHSYPWRQHANRLTQCSPKIITSQWTRKSWPKEDYQAERIY